ncbi:hypothetical protein [Streptomyces sp900116325]|uniref:Uncharacterized protein n=1 Tax=Streptomyces sp. 900116325 TaxID=3154295 RepID=A0ABV2U0K6_9ACTN
MSGTSATAAGSVSSYPSGSFSVAESVQDSCQRARPCRTSSPPASCSSPARSLGLANSRAARPVAARASSDLGRRSAICHSAPASIASSAAVSEPSLPATSPTTAPDLQVGATTWSVSGAEPAAEQSPRRG